MNGKQEDKAGMYLSIKSFLSDHAVELAGILELADKETELSDLITEMFAADAKATADTKGYTEAKHIGQLLVAQGALHVGRGAASYFFGLNDPGTAGEITFSKSDLIYCRDSETYTRGKQVYAKANPVKASLPPFGVTVAAVDLLNTRCEAYLAMLQLPERKRDEKYGAGVDVDLHFVAIDKLLEEHIDNLVGTIEESNPVLFAEYQAARSINSSGGGSPNVEVFEGVINTPGIAVISTPGIIFTDTTLIKLEMVGTGGRGYFSDFAGNPPGPGQPFLDVQDGQQDTGEAGPEWGFVPGTRIILSVQNIGMSPGQYKITVFL